MPSDYSKRRGAGLPAFALSTCILATLVAMHPQAQAASPIQVMLLDGESGGTYHAWQLTTPVLKKELEEQGATVELK